MCGGGGCGGGGDRLFTAGAEVLFAEAVGAALGSAEGDGELALPGMSKKGDDGMGAALGAGFALSEPEDAAGVGLGGGLGASASGCAGAEPWHPITLSVSAAAPNPARTSGFVDGGGDGGGRFASRCFMAWRERNAIVRRA